MNEQEEAALYDALCTHGLDAEAMAWMNVVRELAKKRGDVKGALLIGWVSAYLRHKVQPEFRRAMDLVTERLDQQAPDAPPVSVPRGVPDDWE